MRGQNIKLLGLVFPSLQTRCARMAQWIRRLPTEQEILGSSPSTSFLDGNKKSKFSKFRNSGENSKATVKYTTSKTASRVLAAINQTHYSRHGVRPRSKSSCVWGVTKQHQGHRTTRAGQSATRLIRKRPREESGTRHKAPCFCPIRASSGFHTSSRAAGSGKTAAGTAA